MNGKKKYLDKAILLISGTFVLLLPLDVKMLSFLIGLMLVLSLVQSNKPNVLKNIQHYKGYFIFFILLLIWQLISIAWTNDISSGLKSIEHRGFYIIAPLLFALFRELPSKKLIKIFIVSNFSICVVCFFNLIYFFFSEKMYFIEKTLNGGIQVETFRYITYHSGANFIMFDVHRLYFSFSLLSSLLFLYFNGTMIKNRYVKYAMTFTFVLVIFLIQSKISIILLGIFLLYATWQKLIKSNGRKRILILSGFFIIVFLGVYLSRIRFGQSIDQINEITENKEGSLTERYQYIKCSMELIKEAPIFGYGIGDVNDVVKGKLIKYNYTHLLERGVYDPHNEFLKVYIGTGVIGFLLFLGIFVSLFYKAYSTRNRLLLFYVGFVFFICLAEPFLSRQAGILPILFFIGLLAYKERNIGQS
ncbi:MULTISPECIES: O-antigen ligase family protein [Flavobacteriaceae]|uniref:O-antigen ligase family protein n=1 Tax=Flavobacteriaceae TaxID=49546 RepID=UPI00234B7C3B|nr:O-antigen ligase family protein [Muricauda sp. SP22]MDC6362075.1 O-antigen ligase family protein [Muricauda sp. SP22]